MSLSACKRKKLCKVVLMQLQLLIEYIEKNPALVLSSSFNCDENSKDQMHWEEVATILNTYPNSIKKSPSEWRKYWNKKIIAVRRKVTEQKIQNLNHTLLPFEARVWKIIAEADKIAQDHNMPTQTIKLEPDIDNTQSPNKTTKSEEDFRFTIQTKPKEPISQTCSTGEDIQYSTGVIRELKQEEIDIPQSPPAATEPIYSQTCSTAEDIQHSTGIWEIKQEEIDIPLAPPASNETGDYAFISRLPLPPGQAGPLLYTAHVASLSQYEEAGWDVTVWRHLPPRQGYQCNDSATSDKVPAWASDLQRRWTRAEERQALALERLAASMGTITKAVKTVAANTVNTQQLAARIEMFFRS